MTTNVESVYKNSTNLRSQQSMRFEWQTDNPIKVFNKLKTAQVHSTTHENITDEAKVQKKEDDIDFEREQRAFLSLSEQNKKKYHGKFVAIHKGKIVASDIKESKLIGRFFKKYGDVRVYIDKVGDKEETLEILSPFFLG